MARLAVRDPILHQSPGPYSPRGNMGLAGFKITDEDTRVFIDLIYQKSGIVLAPDKKSLISSRLHKRLTALDLRSFREYLDYLFTSPERDSEIITMIGEITTNKTAFFREKHHFDYLVSHILPELASAGRTVLNIWCAGCSTGEEPYSLAMVLTENSRLAPAVQYPGRRSLDPRAASRAFGRLRQRRRNAHPRRVKAKIHADGKRRSKRTISRRSGIARARQIWPFQSDRPSLGHSRRDGHHLLPECHDLFR